MPALRLGDEKVAKHLHARDRLEFLRIDEIGVVGDLVVVAEQMHQAAVLLDQIVRQHGDAQSTLAGKQHAEHVVDGEPGQARVSLGASDREQPIAALLEPGLYGSAENDEAMLVELLNRARRAESLEVFRRCASVEMQREQLALDQ